ncbi:MAG: zinc metallopeptidase [Ruminococcus sp.]|nr:zinc metallopeptidase [Ruminococcus sp.]
MGFWPDYYYIILVVPAMLIALIAQANVKGTYRKMAKIQNRQGITGAMAAQRVLSYYGITNVRIEQIGGSLTDHYDPRSNVIRLSPQVFAGASIASVGIACHEAGHAAQHAEKYVPIKLRNKILPFANIGSSVGIWLAIIGYFMNFGILVDIGIVLYACVALFQFVTLPVEFNASIRAMKVIDETGMLYSEEQAGAKKVLRAAAMTYVAALLTAIASLLRLILRFNRQNNRNR